MDSPWLTLMVGLPRSGKSTWAKHNQLPREVILSADKLRLLVYNQDYWGPGEPLVRYIRDILLHLLMEQKTDIILDQTHINPRRRKPPITLGHQYGYKIRAVYITTGVGECLARTKNPELKKVIIDMNKRFTAPDHTEGIDHILQA